MAGKCSHCAFPIELSPMQAGWPVVEVTMRRQMAGVWMAAPCWWCETHPAPGAPWWEQELQGLRGRLGQPVLRTSEGCVSDIAEGSDMQIKVVIFVSIPPSLWLQLLWLHQGGLSPSAATSLLQLMCSLGPGLLTVYQGAWSQELLMQQDWGWGLQQTLNIQRSGADI